MLFKIIKKIFFYLYLISKINWYKFFSLHDRKSVNIIWIFQCFPQKRSIYFRSSIFENDVALINALINQKKSFKLLIGRKKIFSEERKNIFYNISKMFDGKNEADYVLKMQQQIKILSKNNKVFPELQECCYWENKGFMQEKFSELLIPHPKTLIINSETKIPSTNSIELPVLFKPSHSSGSTGIVKIENESLFKEIVKKNEGNDYLLQEWINMKSDLRLIYIGDELILHYWRINIANEWKPTSTDHGSKVDFNTLPEAWMSFIYEQFRKLNLSAAAFDITWRNNDLSKEPLFLEVSPAFMPNPKPHGKYVNKSYKDYKKTLFGKDAYFKSYINVVFDLKEKLVKHYFKTHILY